jgi:hypothetical protein
MHHLSLLVHGHTSISSIVDQFESGKSQLLAQLPAFINLMLVVIKFDHLPDGVSTLGHECLGIVQYSFKHSVLPIQRMCVRQSIKTEHHTGTSYCQFLPEFLVPRTSIGADTDINGVLSEMTHYVNGLWIHHHVSEVAVDVHSIDVCQEIGSEYLPDILQCQITFLISVIVGVSMEIAWAQWTTCITQAGYLQVDVPDILDPIHY